MSYIQSLDQKQSENLGIIVEELKTSVITNRYSRAAALAITSKECEFRLKEEMDYSHTSAARIREIFGIHFKGMSDAEIDQIKMRPVDFFNRVYGGMYGNGPEEGWLYRGRGFNEVTFKGNYIDLEKYLKVGLVYHPELLNTPHIAAKAEIQYFINRFNKITAAAVADIHARDINGFANLDDAVLGFYRANAGWAKQIFPDRTGGFSKAHDRAPEFLQLF